MLPIIVATNRINRSTTTSYRRRHIPSRPPTVCVAFLVLTITYLLSAVESAIDQTASPHYTIVSAMTTTTEKSVQPTQTHSRQQEQRPPQRRQPDEVDLDRLQRTIMEGLGLAKIPDVSRVSWAQEYFYCFFFCFFPSMKFDIRLLIRHILLPHKNILNCIYKNRTICILAVRSDYLRERRIQQSLRIW